MLRVSFISILSKQELLTISNVPLADCPPSPPRTAPPTMKVTHTHIHTREFQGKFQRKLKEEKRD